MSIIISQQFPREFDRTRDQISVDPSAWLLDEVTSTAIRKAYPAAVGGKSYRVEPLPFAREYPCLHTRVSQGDLMFLPYPRGGWVCQFIPDFRAGTATAPLVLSRNTEAFYGATVVFPDADIAAAAAVMHAIDAVRYTDQGDHLFWCAGSPLPRQVMQPANAAVPVEPAAEAPAEQKPWQRTGKAKAA